MAYTDNQKSVCAMAKFEPLAAAGTTIRRRIVSNGRVTLLILLATMATATPHPDGHTPGDEGDGHRNDTGGHYNNVVENPGNETVNTAENLYSEKMTPREPRKLKEQLDTSKIDIDLLNNVEARRVRVSTSMINFNLKRKRFLTTIKTHPIWTKGIIYWMHRDQRVQDNWSLLFAQKLAMNKQVPLHVLFFRPNPASNITLRQYKYMIQGLKEVQSELQHLNIQFHFLYGSALDILPDFVRNHKIGGIIVDFFPLRDYINQTKQLAQIFNFEVPVIMVDAHNVVPCWSASRRIVHAPSPLRNKIEGELQEFLTEFPPVVKHPFRSELIPQPINWEETDTNFTIDRSVLPVPNLKAGYRNGILELENFMKNRLKNYFQDSLNPMKNGLSNLSPWLHFGQISAQRVILEINRFSKKYSVNARPFLEGILLKRELSDNFCFYNPLYDSFEGARSWAKRSLNNHRNDTRRYLYSRVRLEMYQTHDPLWNAAQLQMVIEGKMHRFLRLYWAKKLLEWTDGPEKALDIAIYLNNKYSIDGNDPNSYVGCMMAICGVHDAPWMDRLIYGKIRIQTRAGCEKKFDVKAYINKYRRYIYSYT